MSSPGLDHNVVVRRGLCNPLNEFLAVPAGRIFPTPGPGNSFSLLLLFAYGQSINNRQLMLLRYPEDLASETHAMGLAATTMLGQGAY